MFFWCEDGFLLYVVHSLIGLCVCVLFLLLLGVFYFKLSMHNKTRNRGLAFVTMETEEEALNALNNLNSFVRLFSHIFPLEHILEYSGRNENL